MGRVNMAQGHDCFVRRFWRTKLVPSIHNLGSCL